MTTALPVHGVDLSHYQSGKLDLAGAKKRGLRWLYHKCTEGTTYHDPNYVARRSEAKAAGLPFGAYHFARAKRGNAAAQARFFINAAKPQAGDLRPALDLETTEGLTMDQLRTWAKTFVKTVESLTGVKPIVYSPYDLGQAVNGCLLWRPRYNNDNRPPALRWDIWQFSNGVYGVPHQVNGIGAVDLNTMKAGLTVAQMQIPGGAAKPAKTAAKKPAAKKSKAKKAKPKMRLTVAHVSMEHGDTNAQHTADVEAVFKRGYDWITGTESGAGAGNLSAALRTAAEKHGYNLAIYARYDTWVAVKSSLIVKGSWKKGAEFALDRSARTKPKPPGAWGDKAVVWGSWSMGPTYGDFSVGAVHYLTKGGAGAELAAQLNTRYAHTAGAWARKAGKGRKLAFLAGDTNTVDRTSDVFYGEPLVTCWDELKKWPNTGHGNIDVVAHLKTDTRVKCVSARVLTDKTLPLNTDHWLVEAVYEITAK